MLSFLGIHSGAVFAHPLSGDRLSRLAHQIEHAPDNADLHITMARILRDSERWSEAIHYLETALKVEPQSTEANYWLADVLFQMEKLERAQGHINRYLKAAPESSNGRNLLGQIYRSSGNWQQAAEQFSLAIKYDTNPSPQIFLEHIAATAFAWPENYLIRKSSIDSARTNKGELIVFVEKLVELELEFEFYQKALNALNSLPANISATPNWLLVKADLFFKQGKKEDAALIYSQIIKTIDSYSQQKQSLKAISQIKRAAEQKLSILS